MKVVDIFREQKCGERVIGKKRIIGAIALKRGESVQVVIEASRRGGREQVSILADASQTARLAGLMA